MLIFIKVSNHNHISGGNFLFPGKQLAVDVVDHVLLFADEKGAVFPDDAELRLARSGKLLSELPQMLHPDIRDTDCNIQRRHPRVGT